MDFDFRTYLPRLLAKTQAEMATYEDYAINGSLLFGDMGTALLVMRLAPSSAIAELVHTRANANTQLPIRELMWGMPGSMLACLSMSQMTAEARWRSIFEIQATRLYRAGILEKFRKEHGDKGIATLQKQHVERMVAAKKTPAAAMHFLLAVRRLMDYAVRVGLRADDPTQGVRRPKYKVGGFYSWTEEDIEKFEAKHPIGSKPRLAMALGLYTGQRRSDVITMGWQHVRDGVIHVKQSKTGTSLVIPIHPKPKAILDVTSRAHLLLLPNRGETGFTPQAFAAKFRRACRAAGLPRQASFHGLRKATARRLAEAGCSARFIASITRHKTLREVEYYVRDAEQAKMAEQAIASIRR